MCERRGVHRCFLGAVDELAAATPETFDTFLALGNNLGLLEGPRRAHKMLAELARLGHPDSTIVGTGLDPYQTDDPIHLSYHAANRQRDRLAGQVTIRVRHRQLATPWFNLLWCSLEELAELCEPAGWTITEVFPGALYGVVLQHALLTDSNSMFWRGEVAGRRAASGNLARADRAVPRRHLTARDVAR